MSKGQSLCCVETLSHWVMYSSELLCYCDLCSRSVCHDESLGCWWVSVTKTFDAWDVLAIVAEAFAVMVF